MEYAGFLLRRERLARNWSQEGLCKGICTISYLSKIEQGKAAASSQILQLLLERLGIAWCDATAEMENFVEKAYTALFSFDPDFSRWILQADAQSLEYSPCGADFLLLKQFALPQGQRKRLDEALEVCMDNRQLALQRLLQNRCEDAMRLYPGAFFTCGAGSSCYGAGDITSALELMQLGYRQASEEGYPRVMLYCKLIMGNCYSNRHDLNSMERHYRIARNLAEALGDQGALESIAYNTAATQLEAGQFEKALSYFQAKQEPSLMDLHKLAVCYEKLGRTREALDALSRADAAMESDWLPSGLGKQMLDLVRLRLSLPQPLKDDGYGTALLECFHRCREELPSGYALFHLPWVIEWFGANRQYKQALELLQEFPDACVNIRF